MKVYLASPNNQQQAEHLDGMPVLLSFGVAGHCEWIHKGYQQSFSNILIDSGAFSEHSTGKKIDLGEYIEWGSMWVDRADAVAGLDSIKGDWRRSLANYEALPFGFPTFHDTDPPELLDDLISMSMDRCRWLGIGIAPPRHGKERWLRSVLDRIPEAIHVHGWAMRAYSHVRRLDSVDSTNWWRDAMKLRTIPATSHLTYGECLEIVVKRYQRWKREVRDPKAVADPRVLSRSLFGEFDGGCDDELLDPFNLLYDPG
jgi:hypothetical protein